MPNAVIILLISYRNIGWYDTCLIPKCFSFREEHWRGLTRKEIVQMYLDKYLSDKFFWWYRFSEPLQYRTLPGLTLEVWSQICQWMAEIKAALFSLHSALCLLQMDIKGQECMPRSKARLMVWQEYWATLPISYQDPARARGWESRPN